ncbi:coproporphyrinogen III oxidase, anaerobic 1 [Jannaschia pagri]|uniref:Coproporphyrinogen-III oxidase n=1 Tax=Jannaschia pagri TaxID=2829797 RepID=A0ABQ4NJP9_9RHOB|nr:MULTISPECIES: oxygen-independent coproporphyrinogen III oxidase [unclassified Jannaschia]GIT90810.1 coproporphyrinogen III oxidase, anaerobic 1 [Jannaschia sp. AI_61]GIT94642.1 coproporphyrinogen III oxidase, anaerobic 1 [Jannaschia sp. AI_62]
MTDHAFLRRHGLFEARAPRYTSYPPAPHFSDGVGAETLSSWLSQMGPDQALSLYVHIPFCRRLCWFCACRTQGTKSDAPLQPYVDALLAEAALIAEQVSGAGRVTTLHLGGGTPTILPPHLMKAVFDGIRSLFRLAPDAEISVEVDPTVLDEDRLDAMAEGGVTRASIGVQDFAEGVQEAIGRPQSIAQTAFAVDGLRQRGIEAINFDLLYGLPLQTSRSLAETLEQAIDLAPDRIALFGYAHVPWASKRQVMIRESDLPDGPMRLDLFNQAAARFGAAGFAPVGIDHFAKPEDPLAVAARTGRLRRSFQGYTTDVAPALIGMGASAISCLPQGYAQNAVRTADWQDRARQGRLATVRGHTLSRSDRLEAAVIEALLCDFTIDPARFGLEVRGATAAITRLVQAWPEAVEVSADGVLSVSDKARPLVRMMAMTLDAYSRPAGRHSVAI